MARDKCLLQQGANEFLKIYDCMLVELKDLLNSP